MQPAMEQQAAIRGVLPMPRVERTSNAAAAEQKDKYTRAAPANHPDKPPRGIRTTANSRFQCDPQSTRMLPLTFCSLHKTEQKQRQECCSTIHRIRSGSKSECTIQLE